METPAEKRCSKCKKIKPLNADEFPRNAAEPDGYHNQCKPCRNGSRRANWAKNPEKHRSRQNDLYKKNASHNAARARDYRQKNLTKIREQERLSRQNHAAEISVRRKQKRAENPEIERERDRNRYSTQHEARRATGRQSYQTNRPARLQSMRQRRIDNPEKVKEERRQDRIRHPERIRIAVRKRLATIKHAPITEDIDILIVAERDHWKCHICLKIVTKKNWSIDHLIPLSKGGNHTYENVALAHRSCNSRRGAGRLPAQLRLLP
jgi:5-methylcytosine-specific restriction endonuclease McrA